jgi:succinoglycan biosynthesis protein ExoA
VHSIYRPRARLGQVFQQYLQYGYWKPFVMKKHGQAASLRHLVPAVFVLLLFGGAMLALLTIQTWPLQVLTGAYAAAVLAMSCGVASSAWPGWAALVRVPSVIIAYHLGYGLGSLAGWFDVVRGAAGRTQFAALTR